MLRLLVILTVTTLTAAIFDKEIDEKFNILPEHEFIDHFNNQNFTWKIKNYEHLKGRRLTGVILDDRIRLEKKDLPVIEHYRSRYIAQLNQFDSRRKWPQCKSISEIYDQGNCGSCWTFGAASVISDRTCIHAKDPVRLSEQDFDCLSNSVCCGGDSLSAFKFWQNKGLVTLDCLPYNITALKKSINQCTKTCTNSKINYRKDKHFGDKVYTVRNSDEDIKAEIIKNGPIQASFTVYEDLIYYSGGVYIYSFGNMVGRHSVRIIGFGNQNGDDYWLVANTWGKDWGEKGYVKIKRFQPELKLEDNLITGLPYY